MKIKIFVLFDENRLERNLTFHCQIVVKFNVINKTVIIKFWVLRKKSAHFF